MNDINFECVMCGGCCRDLRLPVTLSEARKWLERGGQVDVLCEATPWPVEPDSTSAFAAYRRKRTFAASSGTLPIRVAVTVAASFTGACPNLGDDMRCGIYEERPLVCRVYPAEINPFIRLNHEHKLCPPDAWQVSTPFAIDGVLLDSATRAAIEQSRRDGRITVGRDTVADGADVMIDAEDFLNDDDAALGCATGFGAVGAELEAVRRHK